MEGRIGGDIGKWANLNHLDAKIIFTINQKRQYKQFATCKTENYEKWKEENFL